MAIMAHTGGCVSSQIQAEDEQEGEEEEEIVWGAMVDVENLCQVDSKGLAVTRAQVSRAQVDKEEKNPAGHQSHNSKSSQPAFSYESRAANPEAT